MKHGMSLIKAWPWNDERLAGKAEKNEAFFNAGGGGCGRVQWARVAAGYAAAPHR